MQTEFSKEIGPAGKRKVRATPKPDETLLPKAPPDRRHKNKQPVPVQEDSDSSDDGPPLPNGMIKTKVYKRYAERI